MPTASTERNNTIDDIKGNSGQVFELEQQRFDDDDDDDLKLPMEANSVLHNESLQEIKDDRNTVMLTPDLKQSKPVVTKKLLPPFQPDGEHIHQRKSSLPKNSVAPLNILKPKWRENGQHIDSESPKTFKWPPTPTSLRTESPKITSGVNESPTLPRNARRAPYSPMKQMINTKISLSEPQTPSSFSSPIFVSNETEFIEENSVASINSPPSLSHSLRNSDAESLKRLETMRQKHNCIRELYNTEWQYAQDMAVIVRIYMCGSADLGLSVRQIDTLFSNVSQILDVSLSVVAILESHIPPQILHGDGTLRSLDITADSELRVGRAMCLILSGQLYEVYESYIHHSKEQSDMYYSITSSLQRHPQKTNYQAILTPTKPKIDDAKLEKWINECKQRANKFTTAWSLDSLLIKPVQRLGKYPLFLKTLVDCTDPDHADYEDSIRAFNRSKHFLDCVNTRLAPENNET